jgi:hypothetical protein
VGFREGGSDAVDVCDAERIGEGTGKQLDRRVATMRARASAPADERTVFAVIRDVAARSRALAVEARRYERELIEMDWLPRSDAARGGRHRPDLGTQAAGLWPGAVQVRGGVRALQRDCATIALSRSLHDPETRA